MNSAATYPDGQSSGSTLRCIPLTVDNTRACHKNSRNLIKSQIF